MRNKYCSIPMPGMLRAWKHSDPFLLRNADLLAVNSLLLCGRCDLLASSPTISSDDMRTCGVLPASGVLLEPETLAADMASTAARLLGLPTLDCALDVDAEGLDIFIEK